MSGRKPKDLCGKRFGILTALEMVERCRRDSAGRPHVIWKCLCDCGNEIEAKAGDLMEGKKSCGCIGSGHRLSERKFRELHEFLLWRLKDRYKEFCEQLPEELRIKELEL